MVENSMTKTWRWMLEEIFDFSSTSPRLRKKLNLRNKLLKKSTILVVSGRWRTGQNIPSHNDSHLINQHHTGINALLDQHENAHQIRDSSLSQFFELESFQNWLRQFKIDSNFLNWSSFRFRFTLFTISAWICTSNSRFFPSQFFELESIQFQNWLRQFKIDSNFLNWSSFRFTLFTTSKEPELFKWLSNHTVELGIWDYGISQ